MLACLLVEKQAENARSTSASSPVVIFMTTCSDSAIIELHDIPASSLIIINPRIEKKDADSPQQQCLKMLIWQLPFAAA